jgi:hypothetical protein
VQHILRVTWQVAPLQCPLVWRHCSRCRIAMPFACSMKFRTNAQKKRIDVWLIYRCRACDETWNLPVHERIAVSNLAPDLFQAIARNDPALARRYAIDRQRLAAHGHRLEESDAIEVRKSPQNECDGDTGNIQITLALASPCGIRLDRLLASELGVTRSQLRTLRDGGALCIATKPLRSPITDGQSISIDLSNSAIQPELAAKIREGAVEQR